MNKQINKVSTFLMLALLLCMYPLKVHATEQAAIGPVDIASITSYVSQDGWSWDPSTKTLTLSGVTMDGYASYSYTENEEHKGKMPYSLFELPYGSTVVVTEGTVNTLKSRISGGCFIIRGTDTSNTASGITFTGGGTLIMERSEICVYSAADVTFKDLTVCFQNADIPVMTDTHPVKNADGTTHYESTTMTFDNVNITVKDCTGGFYTYGSYTQKVLADDTILATSSIVIKDSHIDMNVLLDEGNERNHHCILIRNGNLTIDSSTLNMDSYHSSVIVWKQYHANENVESLITVTDSTIQSDLSIASSDIKVNNSIVHAETLVTKGETTEFSFDNNDMSFGHTFTNAVKKASITAIPKCTVTFDTLGGSTVPNITIESGNKIGNLPVPTRENYTFVGWSTNKDSTTANVTSDTIITENITLYAVWTKNTSAATTILNEKEVQSLIVSTNTDKSDLSTSKISSLMLKATGKKKAVTLSWKKVSGATSYVIYGNTCGKTMKKLKSVSAKKTSYTFKKLKKGKYYKYIVVAYKKVDGTNTAITMSKSVHCTTTGGKYGNPTAIKGVKSSVNVKVGKTRKLKPTLKSSKKVKTHIAKFRYESSNTQIATVSKKGVITGKKKGNCKIYIYAQNGMCKKITVKVTK